MIQWEKGGAMWTEKKHTGIEIVLLRLCLDYSQKLLYNLKYVLYHVKFCTFLHLSLGILSTFLSLLYLVWESAY